MNNREQRIKNRKEKIKKVIEYLAKPTKVKFWGVTSICEDVCAEEEIGNGLKLAWFQTLNQRPHLWYIKIDSNTDFSHTEPGNEREIVEDIIDILEEEFGSSSSCIEKDENCKSDDNCENCEDERIQYPRLSLDSGYNWGEIDIEATYNKLLAEVK